MNFKEYSETEIVLRLRDRRGREVRAAVCEGLKIKVWTQNPRRYLTYHFRDLKVTEDEDILMIPDFEMESLEPGVIVYRYSFFEHHSETADTVITDIKWRGYPHPGCRPSHHHHGHDDCHDPDYFRKLERITDLLEELDKKLSAKVRGLYNYIQNNYPEEIKSESERAMKAEEELTALLSELDEALKAETTRATGTEEALAAEIDSLTNDLESFKRSYAEDRSADDADQAEKELEFTQRMELLKASVAEVKEKVKKRLESLQNAFSRQVSRLNARIEDEIARKAALDAVQNSAIESEVSRAKGEESRLDAKIDNLKSVAAQNVKSLNRTIDDLEARTDVKIKSEADRAKGAEELLSDKVSANKERISAETSRAQLVERDITEALQKLKQKVIDGAAATDADLTALRIELIEKIDYRIKEIVGAAPEALDTLEEIAAKLQEDDDAIRVLKAILTEKVNIDDVYKKGAVDAFILELRNLLNQESQRAQLAEERLSAALDILNGDDETPGSVKHTAADLRHYVEDMVHALDDSIQSVPVDKIRGWFSE